jgi:hypothetical protein
MLGYFHADYHDVYITRTRLYYHYVQYAYLFRYTIQCYPISNSVQIFCLYYFNIEYLIYKNSLPILDQIAIIYLPLLVTACFHDDSFSMITMASAAWQTVAWLITLVGNSAS